MNLIKKEYTTKDMLELKEIMDYLERVSVECENQKAQDMIIKINSEIKDLGSVLYFGK